MLASRLKALKHPLAQKLIELAIKKHSNLCLSLDVTKSAHFIEIVAELGPYLAMLKTHIDILEDFTPEFLLQLQALAAKHQFFIFEDRKFADIGHTAQLQYQQGIYRIASWADFITCHALPGPGMLQALAQIGVPRHRAAFLVVEMSAAGHLLDAHYQDAALTLLRQHPEFMAGVIAQHRFPNTESWLYCMPGVNLQAEGDGIGQQYRTPLAAMRAGADILIVGRGLYQAKDRVAEAKRYLDACAEFI